MTIEQLKKVHQAVPFRAFVLHMADGRKIPVRHRDFLSHSETGRTVVVHHDGDDFSILDVLMITEIEVANGNGLTSRRRR
jgi:hypothetical protein